MRLAHSRLAHNITTLFIWQGGVYLVPLITTPYLARVLGVEQFGILGIAGNVIGYICLVSDWGFGLSATREVAQNASDQNALREIFWDTVYAKVLLGGIGIVAFLVILIFVPSMREIWVVLFAYALQLLSSMFSANWLLQGLERMSSFAITSLLGRLLTIPLIFLFVHSPKDTAIGAAILGGTFLLSSIASFVTATRYVHLLPIRIDAKGAMKRIIEGANLFLSTGVIQLYTQANLIVLSTTSTPVQSGLFYGADRIRRAVQGMLSPVTLAVYPRINNLLATNKARGLKLMWLVLIGQGTVMLFLSTILFFLSGPVTIMFLGQEYQAAISSVQLLSLLPFICGVSYVLGVDMLLPMGMAREYTAVAIVAGVINVSLLVPLCRRYGALGASGSLVITEMFVTIAMALIIYLRRHRLALS